MKLRTTFSAIIALLFMSFAVDQPTVKNDLDFYQLKGKVQSVKMLSYEAKIKGENIIKDKRAHQNISLDMFMAFNEQGYLMAQMWFDEKDKIMEKRNFRYDPTGKNQIELKKYNEFGALVSRWTAKYNEQGFKTEENWFNTEGFLSERKTYHFDEYGNVKEESKFNEKAVIVEKWISSYNKNNQIIETINYLSKSNPETKSTYQYDEKGNLVETNRYYLNEGFKIKHTTQFDALNHKIAEQIYDRKGLLKETHSYAYNEGGFLSEHLTLDANNTIKEKKTYLHDEKGQLMEEALIDASGSILERNTYQYNAKGLLTKHDTFKVENGQPVHASYTIEYDAQSNWTKKVFFENELPTLIQEREIVYY